MHSSFGLGGANAPLHPPGYATALTSSRFKYGNLNLSNCDVENEERSADQGDGTKPQNPTQKFEEIK